MKILFLTDNFPPEVNAPATRTYEHCKEWVKLGAEVTVITCHPNFPKGEIYRGYKNKWKKSEWMDGIKVIRVWSFITPNEGFILRTLDFISFSVSSFIIGLFVNTDIIIATSPQFFTALSGRTLSFFKMKPWIMEVRDLWPESIKTVGVMRDNLIIKYFEKEEKWCYNNADKIVVVTDSFKEALIKKGISHQKINTVKNGSNLDFFAPKSKNIALIDKLKLVNKRILGYIGTHGMSHNLSFILDCAKELMNKDPVYHFLLIGDGAEKKMLIDKVYNENIMNVTMIDSIPKEEVLEYLSIMDGAIINLRKSDLFTTVIPSKIFETAAMQVPILIGVDGEARQIVEQYHAGLYYEPENKIDFIDKIQFLFSSERNYSRYQAGGKKLAEAFDRKKLAIKMFDIIKNQVERKIINQDAVDETIDKQAEAGQIGSIQKRTAHH